MQNKKKLVTLALIPTLFLSGCGGGVSNVATKDAEEAGIDLSIKASDVNAVKPLSFEEIEAQSAASASDIENTVYQYVSDSIMVDTSNLVSITAENNSEEVSAIEASIEAINEGLKTGVAPNGIDENMMNYMLLKFSTTPYTWNLTTDGIDIKGMDAQTRLYFVDVTYETTDETKELIPDSVIVRGSPDEEKLKQKRYTDWSVNLKDLTGASENAWANMIEEELRLADAMSVLTYGAKDEEVMDGYEADTNVDTDTEEDVINEAYEVAYDENGNVVTSLSYTFEDRWGDIDEIRKTQDGVTLMERAKDAEIASDGLGVTTYSGLTEVAADHGAKMTFRFVLKYSYSIGLDNSMTVQSVYMHDYLIDNKDALISKYTTDTIPNAEVLSPYIETLIKSYRKAISECNHIGLYNLFLTYQKYDTWVENLNQYAYTSTGGFTFEVVGRKGNELAVICQQRTKERAKGTYMTMPTYLENVLLKVKLCDDDTIRIVSVTTLDSNLIGEPLSVIRDVSGISEQIEYNSGNFTISNQQAVEKAIQKFSEEQLKYDGTVSDTFWDIVDMGASSQEKQKIYDYFGAVNDLGATKSIVWLTGYETKSNLYVTCKLREVFFGTESNYDTESTLGIFYRNGEWKVISYARTLAVKTAISKVDSSNCLVEVDKNNASEMSVLHSQINSGTSSNVPQVDGADEVIVTIAPDDEGFDDVAYTTSATTDSEETEQGSEEIEEPVVTTEETEPAETEPEVDEDDPLAGLWD